MTNQIDYNTISDKIKRSIILNNGYQLDDLVQDTIIKLWLKDYTNEEIKKACVKVARNILIDYHRKQQKLKCIYDKEPEILCFQNEKLNITEPIKNKELFILRYKFGLKYKEIAEFKNKSLGTIKSEIFVMHKELKELNKL